jgi:uncharacterized protein with FMN-binding domain
MLGRARLPLAIGTLTTVMLPVAAPAAAKVSSRSFTGRSVNTRYGRVQVTIVVSGRRLISVGASAPTSPPRAAQITARAVPALSREALQAQSAHIHTVSGATMTSHAFETSLASALSAAHL